MHDSKITVNVDGVGYVVDVGSASFTPQESVELFIYTHITDRSTTLFGFRSSTELHLFEDLLNVSGVGPKGAIALVSGLGVQEIISAIINEDEQSLKVPGVGKKLIKKILIEMKDKLEDSPLYDQMKGDAKNMEITDPEIKKDAEDALIELGYSQREISEAFKQIEPKQRDSAENLIKSLLKAIQN